MTTVSSAAALLTHQHGSQTQGASSAFGAFTDTLDASSSSDPTADPTTAQPLADQVQSLLLEMQSAAGGQPATPTPDNTTAATQQNSADGSPVTSTQSTSTQSTQQQDDLNAAADSSQSTENPSQTTADASTQPSVLAQLQQTLTQALQNYSNPSALLPIASLMV
jgi:hypothetical protein